ncbi:MAG: NAD-dependent epimerase/dehydratase family protein [Desulfobacter sp.]|nr:MAG: NAD-dependent epimerase/dehydratase family protein [Desulfobacter sp.]
MKNIFITGQAGYIATCLAESLLDHTEVEKIVGIDIRPPDPARLNLAHPKFHFIQRGVKDNMEKIIVDHGIDTIVHTAWVLAPDHDARQMEDINVRGTHNILEAAKRIKVDQILYTSSTKAYGFHPDNEIPLTEESPLRGNTDFTYAKNKKEMEQVFKDFSLAHPKTVTTILRPCFVAGPGLDNPLSHHLQKPFVPLIRQTAPFQYVHEDDLVRIMVLSLEQRLPEVYNVAPEGTMEFNQMVRILGNRPIQLPDIVVRIFNNIAWHLRLKQLTQFPNPALNLMRHPWIASSKKLIQATGYQFQYNTQEAFLDYARYIQTQGKYSK